MTSLWHERTSFPNRDKLHAPISTDVAIIGGGMVGLLTATLLKDSGVSCVVLEAGSVGSGQTGLTTAKITAQHGLKYRALTDKFGASAAGQYADAMTRAIGDYAWLVNRGQIACDFERLPACLYSRKETARLEAERDAMRALRLDADMTITTTLPFSVAGALALRDQAQFQPLAFLKAIAEDLTIYEHTPVRAVESGTIFTDEGTVTAARIVIATHFPIINAPGYYFIRMHQERSYILALENAPLPDAMYYGIEDGEWSWRPFDRFVLFGGSSHRTGENPDGGQYDTLRKAAAEWCPAAREVAHWSAQDCMTLDGVPYIGAYSPSLPEVYVATGFNKWGMTGSMAAARCLTDLLTGKPHPYPLFSPHRFHLSADLTALFSQTVQSVKGLSAGMFSLPQEEASGLLPDTGAVVTYHGRKLGVYKAASGRLFTVSARCTHLGCELMWNPEEHTWDCPCHGSRFDIYGQPIDSPAVSPLPCDHTP